MTRPLGFMDMAIYDKVIDEIATFSEPVRAKEIELFHFGESLLHPKLNRMVAKAAESGLRAVLSVNAPHLTPERAEQLIDAQAYKLIISLDGHDNASYRSIRGRAASFDKAEENLNALSRLLKHRPVKTQVVVRAIEFDANRPSIQLIRDSMTSKGLDIEIRPFFPWTHLEFEQLGEYQRLPPQMPCPFPWQYLVVQWDGNVVPCCRDYNAVNVMGNVRQQTLREIWNGPAYEDFRKRHEEADFNGNPICRDCMQIYGTSAPAQL